MMRVVEDNRELQFTPKALIIFEPAPGEKLAHDETSMKVSLSTALDIAAANMGGEHGVVHLAWRHRAPGGSWQPLPWPTSVACRAGMTIGALGAPVTSCHEPDGSDRINLSFDVTPQTGEIELRVKPSAQSAWSAPRRFSYLPPPSSLQPKTGPAIFKGPADRGKAAIDPAPGKGPRSPFEARRPKPPMGDRPLLHKAPTAPSAVRKPGPRVTPVAPAPGKPRAGKAASVTPSAEADDAAPATPTGATAAPAATPQRIQKKQRSLGTK